MSQNFEHGVCAFIPCGRPRESRGVRPFCQTHNKQNARGESLRPIRMRYNKPDDGLCTFEGCGRPWHAALWCKTHYDQHKAGLDLVPILERGQRRGEKGTCRGPECDRPATDFDLCNTHRTQERAGKELTPILHKTKYGAPEEAWFRDELGRKQCLDCKEWFPPTTEFFQKRSQAKDGLQTLCKPCFAVARAPWTSKDAVLRRQYGIGEAEYDALLEAQGGVCAGCGRTAEEAGGRGPYLHVDHDHTCCPDKGKSNGCCVRGLLCGACNGALGLVGDNINTLNNLIAYLKSPTIEKVPMGARGPAADRNGENKLDVGVSNVENLRQPETLPAQ